MAEGRRSDDSREPYLELQCTDCGALYTPEQGDCPRCGSANVSYDAQSAKEYGDYYEGRDRHGW